MRVLGGSLAVLGLLLCAWAMALGAESGASYRWPSVDGQVRWSRVKVAQRKHGDLFVFRYGPDVRYAYSVEGRAFESASFTPSRRLSPNVHDAKAIVAAYRPGDAVRVFYDPGQPDRAVLERGFGRMPAWPALAGLACLGLAFLPRRLRSGFGRAPSAACPSAPAPPDGTDAAGR